MHWSACAYAHTDKCIYFKQVHMLTHAAYHFNFSMQWVIDQCQVSRALCKFGRKITCCPWWHEAHMNQLENCQARYRSNIWMGRTRTDGPDEFEPSKFDCNFLSIIFSICFVSLHPLFFLTNMQCIMVKVCCKFDPNRTKVTQATLYSTKTSNCGRNDRRMERQTGCKQYTHPLNYVCGGYGDVIICLLKSLKLLHRLTLKAPRKKCISKCRLLKSSAANNCLTLLTN